MKLKGLIFDKDGTLFDFNATWGAFSEGLIETLAGGDAARADAIAEALGYDAANRVFRPGAIVIAATTEEVAEAVRAALPGHGLDEMMAILDTHSARAPQVETAPLGPLLGALARDYVLGLVTNDTEAPARAHLAAAAVTGHFSFIAGHDSGWGGKPAPGQLHAFCQVSGLAPGEVAMIGDSTHDLQAGKAAGMRAVGVLTGPATAADLAPHADVVLPDIGALPAWLEQQNR